MADEFNKEDMLQDDRVSFYLHKFKQQIKLTKVKYASICFNSQICAVNYDDRLLQLHSFHPKAVKNAVLSNIDRCCFKNDVERSPDYVEFCTVADKFEIKVYRWRLTKDEEPELLASEVIQSWVDNEDMPSDRIEAVDILLFQENTIVISIDKKLVVQLNKKEGSLTATSTLAVGHGIHSMHICQGVFVALRLSENILVFYSLSDSKKILEIDLSAGLPHDSAIQTYSISPDLSLLVIVYDTGELLLLDLVEYSSRNTKAILWQSKHSPGTQDQLWFRHLETCKYGEFSWREKLLSLHSRTSPITHQEADLQNVGNSRPTDVFCKFEQCQVKGFLQQGVSVQTAEVGTVAPPVDVQGYSVEAMHLEPGIISLVYMYHDSQVLAQWHTATHTWTTHSVEAGERFILSCCASVPHVALTATHLVCVITDPNISQQQFVSELMVYGGAALAESVCQLNNWGRCSLPMHTLEVGLKHRQLDTVIFFLKSKEKLFWASSAASSPPALDTSPHWPCESSCHDNLLQLEPSLSLLLHTARSSLDDKHALMFGKQVLDTTLDFLYGLLLEGVADLEKTQDESRKADIQITTDMLLGHLEEARGCVELLEQRVATSRAGSASAASISTGSTTSTETHTQHNQTLPWDSMDIETVIEEGIMENRLAELQDYLLHRGEHARAHYSSLKTAATTVARNYCKYGNIHKAINLLAKLGVNEVRELWQLALYSPDAALCHAITQELTSRAALSHQQAHMVTFLKQLNHLYPCRNFEQLKSSHQHVKDSETHDVHRLKALTHPTPVFELIGECGSLSTCSGQEEGRMYNEVLLQWVGEWDCHTQALILLDVLLYAPGPALEKISGEVVWEYLLCHNQCELLQAWLALTYTTPHKQQQQQQQPGPTISNMPQLPPTCVDLLNWCTPHVSRKLLKAFSRHGVYRCDAVSSLEALLQQVTSVGGILHLPHPLAALHTAHIQQVHVNVIHYSLHHYIPYFLWVYWSLHRVPGELLQTVSTGEVRSSWLPLFSQFYSITTAQPTDQEAVYGSSLCNAAFVWGGGASCIGDMLQGGHTLAALATLMVSPHRLQQVTFVTQQMEAFDGLSSEVVEQAIKGYPKLYSSLFPASTDPHADTATDVSVYRLLIGNSPFDPHTLFGWQSTNTCAGEDGMKELPYFSDSQLTSSYGYTEQLRYMYYLKQGRPSFAFVAFLAEELKNGGPTIHSKRLLTAVGSSLWLGIQQLQYVSVVGACVMFQELLGEDSLLLRTLLQVGRIILAHRNNALTGSLDTRQQQARCNEQHTVGLLLDCVQSGGKFAARVLQALEAAILAALTKDMIPMYSFESGQRWMVAVLFCHLMQLPYTTVFLESCAQANQWLPFSWFAQLHQYPKEQLCGLLHMFGSVHLQEHLRYILTSAHLGSARQHSNNLLAKQRSHMAARDVRARMLNKIGMVKGKDSDETSSSGDEDGHDSGMQRDADTEEDPELHVSYAGAAGDVFGVMFAAHTTSRPWKSLLTHALVLRNPLFAELAACYEGAGPLPCLCSWLAAMMDSTEHADFLEHHGKSPWRYSLATLDAILDIFVKQRWGSVLVTGFDIFQQDSPLLPFLQFYADFTERKSYNSYLDVFKEAVFQFHHASSVRWASTIGSSQWLEKTTFRIIQHMLTSTSSIYELTQLLKTLDAESITLVFKDVDPDFRQQYQLVQCVEAGGVSGANMAHLLCPASQQLYEAECHNVLQQLINNGSFSQARTFTRLTHTSTLQVTIQQVEQEKSRLAGTELWRSRAARLKFYKECAARCRQHDVDPAHTLRFFQGEAEASGCAGERADLYQICLQTVHDHTSTADQGEADSIKTSQLYRSMWLNKIQHTIHSTQGVEGFYSDEDMFTTEEWLAKWATLPMKKELLCFGKMPRTTDQPTGLTAEEQATLQKLMGEMLSQGQITQCCRLASEFNIYCHDLAIILTCIRLSLGLYQLENLGADMLHLLRTVPGEAHRQSIAAPVALLRNSSSISLMSNIQPMVDCVSEENEEKIATMERLLNHCNHGKQICVRVLTAFKISTILDLSYEEVISEDDYNILRSLLNTNCAAKYRLASDFLGTSALAPEEVAGFLSDAIVQTYRVSLGEMDAQHDSLFLHHSHTEQLTDWHHIVRLCPDPSLLGARLLQATAAMATSQQNTSSTILTLQTELLILAHDCYTASCDMEGISNILRATRIITTHLAENAEYQLMTRLVTGIGRYNEMTYIFDCLQENHQFELLLGKGMEKEMKLKTAILDYLKRYHPSDTDTYTMVALKFMMYREIAQLLEANARKLMHKIKATPIDSSVERQTCLQKAAQYYSEAAESYVKDSCLRHAQACIRQARILALQLKYLPSNLAIINLSTAAADRLIAEHPLFTEAFIISEAYGRRDNWALALCNNVIVRADMKYLQDFKAHMKLSTQLIQEAIDRYEELGERPGVSVSGARKLVQLCRDVAMQYRLARRLALRDTCLTLERGDSHSYIHDTMATMASTLK